MSVIVAGISHWTSPIEVRERCAFGAGTILPTLESLRARTALREAVLLSTCNRTEFYLVEGDEDAVPAVWELLGTVGYVRRDREAVRHLMRVAAGLDAMILGEAQIQGQVRDAWEMSRPQSGPMLNRAFQSALGVAGRVRTETAIGRGAASVSSAAVQLAKQIFGTLAGRSAMVLGAGDMAELALECLVNEGVRAALVANRTYERAEALARRHGATAIHYDAFWQRLGNVDLLLCSTAAPHPIVLEEHVRPALASRGDRPLCILDIAVPRDVDPAVGTLDNVFLYDVDDLRAVIAANLDRRREHLPSAEQLIEREVEKYWQWLAGLAAVPVVTDVRAAMERLREAEVAAALKRLGDVTPEQRETIEYLSRALMNKFLHEPSVRLRAAAANGRGLGIVDAARYLFGVDEHEPT